MNEVKSAIEQALDANGGVMTWAAMVAAVPTSGRRLIWAALAELQAENKAKAQNRYDPVQGGIFEIVRIGQ